MPGVPRSFPCVVTRVVDGDTVDVSLDLGFGFTSRQRVRLSGVDAPETFRPRCAAEREHGRDARGFVDSAVSGRACVLDTECREDKYGRVLGVLRVEGEARSVNDMLRERGLTKRADYGAGPGQA